jgi:hypothetical protein
MFAAPGLILLVVFDYFKPQEYIPALANVPFLYIFAALTVVGFVVDLRLGLSRLASSPQLWLAVAFFVWCLLTDLPISGSVTLRQGFTLLIPVILCLLTAHVIQTFRMLRVVMVLLLAVALSIAFVGTHQGFAPWGCHQVTFSREKSVAVYDGRPCSPETARSCYEGVIPGAEYVCERVGLLGTHSVLGRVRFRGTVQDPNELALLVVMAIPIAFAFVERRRSLGTVLLAALTFITVALCVIFTRSRGGQVVFAIVLGAYFVRKFGTRGLVVALVCAVPIVLFGGRSGGEATGSTMERLECWSVGMRLFRHSPLLGVGLGQFTEHHYLTAHNSYVLTAAELGFVGMVLWMSIVYVSVKIPAAALFARATQERGSALQVATPWSLATLAALAGTVGGMLFLSYAYKESLWIWIGLSGALYQAIRRHDPSFRVEFRRKDLGIVAGIAALLIVATTAYTRLKLGY